MVNIHHTTHVLTIGVRATVPLRNLEVLEGLQVPKKDREELQQGLCWPCTPEKCRAACTPSPCSAAWRRRSGSLRGCHAPGW
eukprot:1177594-Prorocentrum_minimum.AAC.2